MSIGRWSSTLRLQGRQGVADLQQVAASSSLDGLDEPADYWAFSAGAIPPQRSEDFDVLWRAAGRRRRDGGEIGAGGRGGAVGAEFDASVVKCDTKFNCS